MKKKNCTGYLSQMNLASVFCEAISHKLNNSLSGILGYLQFTLEKMAGDSFGQSDLEKIRRYLSMALEECKSGRNLMVNLRSFNKEHVQTTRKGRKPSSKLLKTLKAIWGEMKESGNFGDVDIEWEKSGHGDEDVAVTQEDLFCLLYTVIFSISQLMKSGPARKITVCHTRKEDGFLETAFRFSVNAPRSENEIKEAFLLTASIVKSVFCRIGFSAGEKELLVLIGFPLTAASR